MLDDQITSDTSSTTGEPEGAPTAAPEPPTDAPTEAPARAPRKRAPRKTAAKKTAPPQEESTADADPATAASAENPAPAAASGDVPTDASADVPAHHPPAKKTTRSRRSTAKKAVSASEPGGAAEVNAEGIAPAQAVDAPGISALPSPDQPADQPAAADVLGGSSGTGAAAGSTDGSVESRVPPAATTVPLFQPPQVAAAPAKRAPRKRTAKKTTPAPVSDPSADPSAADQTDTTAPAGTVVPTDAGAAVAAAPTEPLPLDLPEGAAAPDGVLEEDEEALAEAAAAAAGTEDVDGASTEEAVLAVDAEPLDPSEAVPDDTDESERDGGPRRRRRRGGRRRRKGGDTGESGARGDEDDDSEAGEGAPAAGDEDASDAPAGAAPAEEPGEGEKSEGGSSRRRRRRRRTGDGEDGATGDDPENTVTKVRKGRTAEDEITGFTGSTRLEAKKQRRREGREAGRRRAPIISEAEFLARRESVDRTMVIRQRRDLTQIAVLEDRVLVEHYVARESQTSLMGNVYLGRVQNVLPSMEAAFVDIGKGRNAVLYAGEVNWDSFGVKDGQRKIEQVLKSGQTVLVQVSKDPVGHKGARLTSQISLPGRFLVYVPDGTTSGISRKLPENERTRLKTLLKEIVPEGAGVIVRTAAEGASEEELTRDVERLTARWEELSAKAASGNAPQLLYGEPDLTLKVVRDLFTEDFANLVVSGDDAWDLVHGYVSQVAPDLLPRIEKHDDSGGDAFVDLRIDEQIAKALDRKVFLPSGGSLVIDRTEAMTVVDVNTGKFTGSGGNLEETVTRNNLEAAEEIVRQLRLRDIGGIIVVDFIDMVLESNRDLVLRRLVECLGRDRTRHQVAEVTSLGLVQMTRKRIGTGLLEAFSEPCEACQGRGVHVHAEPVDDKRRPAEDEQPSRSGRSGRPGRRGRDAARADDTASESSSQASSAPKRPTPADFAAMARAEVVAAAADAAAAADSADAAGAAGAGESPTDAVVEARFDASTDVASDAGPEVVEAAVSGATAPDVTASGSTSEAPSDPPVDAPVDVQPDVQPAAQPDVQPEVPVEAPVSAAPRLVTTVRRRGARRPAGPPVTAAVASSGPTAASAGNGAAADGPDGTDGAADVAVSERSD